MEVFKDYAYYYNAFYGDKDYKKEAGQVDSLLKKYGQNVNRVINLGCGTGRHDIELSKIGYHCAGVDLSSSMIDIARENTQKEGINIDFDIADIRDYRSDQKYDAVISLFHVMSYQNTNQDIISAFKTARNLLEKDGTFIFDVWYGSGVLTDQPCVRVKKVADEKNEIIRLATPVLHDKENLVDVNYEVLVIEKETGQTRVINETHYMRYFFRPELEYFLKEAGFELIENIDCETLGETDYSSWTSYFIAKAI